MPLLGFIPRTIPRYRFRWILVCAVFMSQFFASGYNWSYGVWAAIYCEGAKDTIDNQMHLCTLPGAVAQATLTLFGLVVGAIAEHPRVGFRITALIGAILWTVGFIGAGFSNSFAATVITQGFVVGMGCSFSYFACLGLIPRHFAKEGDSRVAAFGLAISGTGFGGFSLSAATAAMVQAWGVEWTLWATGIMGGAVLSLCALLCIPPEAWVDGDEQGVAGLKPMPAEMIKSPSTLEKNLEVASSAAAALDIPTTTPELKPATLDSSCAALEAGTANLDELTKPDIPPEDIFKDAMAADPALQLGVLNTITLHRKVATLKRMTELPPPPMTLRQVIKTTPFILSCGIAFFLPFGSLSPAYFGASYSRTVLGMDNTSAAFMVSILNIASTVGRASQGLFAQKFGGPTNNLVVCVFFAGFFQLVAWPFVKSPAGMIVFMVFQVGQMAQAGFSERAKD